MVAEGTRLGTSVSGDCVVLPGAGAGAAARQTTAIFPTLRDSSAIEEVADLVLLLYRDDVYVEDSIDPDTMEVAMAKNRTGLHAGTAGAVSG